jgi:selenium metabolism protein YedF
VDIGSIDIKQATAFVIASDTLGRGDDELGALLMKNFIYSLARTEAKPRTVGFMNGGVRLTCEGSPSLDDLVLLVQAGVKVRSCGTCLDFLGLKDKLAVGEVGTMPDTAALLAAGDAVVIG